MRPKVEAKIMADARRGTQVNGANGSTEPPKPFCEQRSALEDLNARFGSVMIAALG